MLVLGRKPGEKLCIGNNISVTVLGIHGNVVKLGIEAPRDVRVLRSELQRSIPAVRAVAQFHASTFDASADVSVRAAQCSVHARDE